MEVTSPPATRDQADAHRFGMRRLEAALVRGDPVPLHEQLRSQRRATVVGALLAVLGLVGAAVYAALSPRPDWAAQALVVGTPSGAVFAVARDPNRLVPVADAVAGRLVLAALGVPFAEPRLVRDEDLATAARVPAVDVPGASGVRLGGPAVPARWAVCDGPAGTTVLAGTWAAGPGAGAVFIRAPGGAAYAVLGGTRYAVGTDPAVLTALGLAGADPRRVGAATLSAIPEGPPLTLPGWAAGSAPAGVPGRVGDVVATTSVDGVRRLHAVVPGGVQEVPATLAEALRVRGGAGPREVAPAVLAEVPRREPLSVAGWPAATPTWSAAAGTLCATWADGRWDVVVAPAPPAIREAVTVPGPVTVVLAGGGPVKAVSPTGGGTIWLVSAAGAVHGVADAATAEALGIRAEVPEAPEAALRLLPQGGAVDLAVAKRAVGVG